MSLDGLIGKFKSEFEHIREERARAEQHNVQTKIEEKPEEKPAEPEKPAETAAEAPAEAPEGEAPKE